MRTTTSLNEQRGAKRRSDKICFCDVSIFGLPTKYLEIMLKWRRTVVCLVHGEGASAIVIVCYDRRACDNDEPRYGRARSTTTSLRSFACIKTHLSFINTHQLTQRHANTHIRNEPPLRLHDTQLASRRREAKVSS